MMNFGHSLRVPKPVNPLAYVNDVQSQGELDEKTSICFVVRCGLGRASLGSVYAGVFERICFRSTGSEGEVLEDPSKAWLCGQKRWLRRLRYVRQLVAVRILSHR